METTTPPLSAIRLGLISDTHGLLRPRAQAALAGSRLIIHAGDVGDPRILEELEQVAPVVAVRGNMDRGPWAQKLPLTQLVEVAGVQLYVLHELYALDLEPAAAGISAVICGHSHRPAIFRKHGVLYLNPGSAGPRRFTLPVTVALLHLNHGLLTPEIVTLEA